MVGLNTLPVELVELVASEIEQQSDICSLRLVCRHIHQCTTPIFAKRWLSNLRTDLSARDLADLEKLSTSGINKYVRSLIIARKPRRRNEEFTGQDFGYGNTWYRHESGYLIFPLLPVGWLRNALANGFSKCTTFKICSNDSGESTATSEWISSSDALAVLLTIIAEAGVPVESFNIEFCETEGQTIDMTRIPPAMHQEIDFRVLWKHLTELSLALTLTEQNQGWTRKLIQGATRLHKLSLTTVHLYEHPDNPPRHFFDYAIASWEDVPPLQEFNLRGDHISTDGMIQFISRVADSLQILSLESIHLSFGKGSNWKSVLENMEQSLIRLKKCSLRALFDGSRTPLEFPTLLQKTSVPPDGGWTECGPGLQLYIRKWKGGHVVLGVRFERPASEISLETLGRLITPRR